MIYNRLKLLRTDRGLSRQQLADMLDVNYQTVGFIERGDYLPSLELAFQIASTLEASVTDVFSDQPFSPLIERKPQE